MSKYIIPTPKNLYNVNIKSLLCNFLNFENKNLIFFDIETLGLTSNFEFEQILQISAWCVDGNTFEKKEEFDIKVKLSEATTFFLSGIDRVQNEAWKRRQKQRGSILNEPHQILKFTNYFNLDTPELSEKDSIQEFNNFISEYDDVILIAHNIDFDIKFILSRCKLHKLKFKSTLALDTLKVSQFFFAPLVQTIAKKNKECETYLNTLRGLSKTNKHISSKLGHLAIALGFSSKNWHTASADVEMMYYVFKKIVNLLERHRDIDISSAQTLTLNKTQKRKHQLSCRSKF